MLTGIDEVIAEDWLPLEHWVRRQKPLVRRQKSLVQRQKPLVRRQKPLVRRQKSLVRWQKPLIRRQKPLVRRQKALVRRQKPLVRRQQSLVQPQKPLIQRTLSKERIFRPSEIRISRPSRYIVCRPSEHESPCLTDSNSVLTKGVATSGRPEKSSTPVPYFKAPAPEIRRSAARRRRKTNITSPLQKSIDKTLDDLLNSYEGVQLG